jgi:phosphatidylserine/phosphatidylglycerophosphate/cardiolipin synthase-like enzyme
MDDEIIINGSFNWTVQAVKKNQENLTILENPAMVKLYD